MLTEEEVADALANIRARTSLTSQAVANLLGTSLASVTRWESGSASPSPRQRELIAELLLTPGVSPQASQAVHGAFASRGVRRRRELPAQASLLEESPQIALAPAAIGPVLPRLVEDGVYRTEVVWSPSDLLDGGPAPTAPTPPDGGISAGKNTYTYDAHTYHTKVPPQGIAELLQHYLPQGGLVLDPFAGSGMTGVAARVLGYDAILNELSPAACFIASRFVSKLDPLVFKAGIASVLSELVDMRESLYSTSCRECGRSTELLYVVWSYRASCPHCSVEFNLWDACRSYGSRVREHKILREFPCPSCGQQLRKGSLSRTTAEPVEVGYMCCGSRQQERTHRPSPDDLALISRIDSEPPLAEGFYPRTPLPDGVNLGQPKRHGLDSVDKFYTARNLAAMSHLWMTIARVEDPQLAGELAFVFTSLYQRVTRLSEFRFWGGSGNTARFNVPYIFNESNVFISFARKARTILDHLQTTASHYSGRVAVVEHSATRLVYIPDESVDIIFTDPPFGSNINYSEMNILWESWLGRFTDATEEAIISRAQGKSVDDYQKLMTESLRECHRVLRSGHWMLLVFMNSSRRVWESLRAAILDAGFEIVSADVFDKQHGTLKHFVSDNTAGADLVLHCRKSIRAETTVELYELDSSASAYQFLSDSDLSRFVQEYLHVRRSSEVDLRTVYSKWLARELLLGRDVLDFVEFRSIADAVIKNKSSANGNQPQTSGSGLRAGF